MGENPPGAMVLQVSIGNQTENKQLNSSQHPASEKDGKTQPSSERKKML